MFKSILFLILAYTLLLVFAPIVFIILTINTFKKGAEQGGAKQGCQDLRHKLYGSRIKALYQQLNSVR